MLSLIFLLLCDGVLALQPLWLSPQVLDLGPVLRTGNEESWPHPRINEIFFLKMLPENWFNQSFILLITLNQDLMISPPKKKKARNGQLYNQPFVFMVIKWTKPSYFDEEKLKFWYLPTSQNEKNQLFNSNQCWAVLYFYEEPLVPILKNKLRTKFWFWHGSG